jgi:hypothetical protein
MIDLFRRKGLRDLRDAEDIQILSGKGATKAKEHAILLQIEKLPYVLVFDNDQEGLGAKKTAIDDGIPEDRILVLPSSPDTKKAEFAIEDMFPEEIYAKAFFNVHGSELKWSEEDTVKKLSEGNEKNSNKAKRLLKESKYDLDKVRVAKEILKVVSVGELNKSVQERFGQLFDAMSNVVSIYR